MNRRAWFAWHRWLGLGAGLLAVSLSLTGAFLTVRRQYERTANRAVTVVRPTGRRLPLDQLLAAARRQVPDFAFYDAADLPQHPDEALELHHLANSYYTSVFVNPYTGRVTGRLGPGHLARTLLRFHWSFGLGAAGYAGAVLALLAALGVLGAVVTGAVVYRKHLGRVLTFREQIRGPNWRRTASGLHRVLGVWAGLFLLVLFTTGFYLNYLYVGGSFSYATPAQLRQPPRQPLAVSVAALLAETQRRLPGLVPRTVSFPQQVGGPVSVSGTFAADWALWGVPSGADFDARTGRLLAVRDGRRAPVGAKALMAFENLHFGRYGGWPGQLLYCLGGLVAGSLPITGWLLWWGKRRARRRSTKNAAE